MKELLLRGRITSRREEREPPLTPLYKLIIENKFKKNDQKFYLISYTLCVYNYSLLHFNNYVYKNKMTSFKNKK